MPVHPLAEHKERARRVEHAHDISRPYTRRPDSNSAPNGAEITSPVAYLRHRLIEIMELCDAGGRHVRFIERFHVILEIFISVAESFDFFGVMRLYGLRKSAEVRRWDAGGLVVHFLRELEAFLEPGLVMLGPFLRVMRVGGQGVYGVIDDRGHSINAGSVYRDCIG